MSPTQPSVLRMVPIARRIARTNRSAAVFRVLNSRRGWDAQHNPVDDAVWAIDRAQSKVGKVPVGLVGHSLGGRAALFAGARDAVSAVVALNAWLYPSDAPKLAGTSVLFVHGSADHIAPLDRAQQVAKRIAAITETQFDVVEEGRHAMLRRGRQFEQRTTEFLKTALASTAGRNRT